MSATINGSFYLNQPQTIEATVGHDSEDSEPTLLTSKALLRPTGACVDCKAVKVRCEFLEKEDNCRRCQIKGLICRPRERKKRKQADTHEQLQEKALDRDIQIQQLLLQLDKLKADRKVQEWITKALHNRDLEHYPCLRYLRGTNQNYDAASAEVQVISVYSLTHLVQNANGFSLPPIITHCSLYPQVISDLFALFFEHINSFFSILDPDLHTPGRLLRLSPFLFTVICAVASRHYTTRPGLYHLAMTFARDAAGRALVDGSKSVEICQAYLLLAVYPVPKKKWTDDRSWILMGVAIRMAIELKLDQPPPESCDMPERMNRVRTWLNCYCADGSHAIQFGKMPMLRLDDYLARNSRFWFRSSPQQLPYDVHLCAYVQLIVLMAEWRSMIDGHNDGSQDARNIVLESLRMQDRVQWEMNDWIEIYAEEYRAFPLPICAYRGNTTQLIAAYLRLVILASGFRFAAKGRISGNDDIVLRSVEAARLVIQILVERLHPTGHLRYAMEANFIYVSFAAAFLINLFRPKFRHILSDSQKHQIDMDVQQLIQVLGSQDVCVDGRHTPLLHSRFLSKLLAKYRPKTESHPSPTVHWPDVFATQPQVIPGTSINSDTESFYPSNTDSDVEMDFSLSYFMRAVSQESTSRSPLDPMVYMLPSQGQAFPYYGDGYYPEWSTRGY
ncbi:hypothetical protein AMATHDRAFT_53408 [Amanita thiersii Skay4041]|uniref:Zn(2)-C6 fungal-type domain-containing protein n=1 Tax=Amanita thiersii Skay4041 TaxID=703135 RepID=A0A2A9NXZ6_9AGAR|nr:hypothetical protein AMATHDRAFT_53408 [Amanita thiersii Skay4041]